MSPVEKGNNQSPQVYLNVVIDDSKKDKELNLPKRVMKDFNYEIFSSTVIFSSQPVEIVFDRATLFLYETETKYQKS